MPHLYGALGLSDTVHDEGGEPSCGAHAAPTDHTFDSADSGLGHFPCSKKSFSGAGTLDVTGSGLRHSPCSEKSFMKEAKFDSETGTFDVTGSGPGQSTYSKKSFSEAGTLELTGSGLGLSPYSKKSFSEALDVTGCDEEPIPCSRKSVSMHQKISCHLGHLLKRRRAPNEYECDVCDRHFHRQEIL